MSRKHQALADSGSGTDSATKSAACIEFMVGRSAEEVLGRAQIYFSRRWPHDGDVTRKRASIEFLATTKIHYGRLFAELLKVAALSLLTAGLYLLYWLGHGYPSRDLNSPITTTPRSSPERRKMAR